MTHISYISLTPLKTTPKNTIVKFAKKKEMESFGSITIKFVTSLLIFNVFFKELI
jgi:hypothetical protein